MGLKKPARAHGRIAPCVTPAVRRVIRPNYKALGFLVAFDVEARRHSTTAAALGVLHDVFLQDP
ncbi:MAG: hypothetical protein QOI13_1229 [Paraburkholderia sp.]|nr:hypothetical protein [Paraburkholderia sp.]